jgi:hypothetical protein
MIAGFLLGWLVNAKMQWINFIQTIKTAPNSNGGIYVYAGFAGCIEIEQGDSQALCVSPSL